MRDTFNPFVPKGVLQDSDGHLSEKSAHILRLLGSGLSDEEIIASDPAIKREHIVLAAREALVLNSSARTQQERIKRIVQRHPRAYEKWTHDEELRVAELYKLGKTLREIAASVQRQPSAVKNRLDRLGLFT